MLSEELSPLQKHYMQQAKERGASSWLTALPLKSQGYILNKREFRDSVCLRYGWRLPDIPLTCACGKRNDVDHSLICNLGGYVHLRHNNVRDLVAQFLTDSKCRDVVVEPRLMPVHPENFKVGTNTSPEAQLDVAATGVFSSYERSFFDIRVTHPSCESNIYKPLNQLYREHEEEKKRNYEERVLQSEKGSFVPLVFSTSGGTGPLASSLLKRIARGMSESKTEKYEDVIYHLRVRLRFAILKARLWLSEDREGRV